MTNVNVFFLQFSSEKFSKKFALFIVGTVDRCEKDTSQLFEKGLLNE